MNIGTLAMAGAAACAVGTALFFGGCSTKSSVPPPASVGGGACKTDTGTFPPPNCDDSTGGCTPPSPACPTTPCTSGSPCLAMGVDNSGKTVQDLRMRKLNVTAPAALALHFVQAGVIDQGINLKTYCGEGGDGSFSWLIRFDTTNKKVTTGGAPPTSDPFGVGYCFVNAQLGGSSVAPITVGMTQAGDGSWSSDIIEKLFVPIYVHGDPKNVVVLPLTKSKVTGVTLSPDGNCIGSYNPDGTLAPSSTNTCADQDPSSCQRGPTAGSLGGFITLQEADGVNVVDLGKTLCVLLTSGTSVGVDDAGVGHCLKDASGKVTATGDFCSTTDAPGGCADSYWLAATFAASAAKINDGTADPACNGSIKGDAGTD